MTSLMKRILALIIIIGFIFIVAFIFKNIVPETIENVFNKIANLADN